MTSRSLQVGVLAHSPDELGEFVRVVQTAGHQASMALDTSDLMPDSLPPADVWFISPNYPKSLEAHIDQFDKDNIPVVFEDIYVPDNGEAVDKAGIRIQRARKLAMKLEGLAHGHVKDRVSEYKRASHLWVLAASTGGPKAISEFLDGIPATLDGVALLYVQHINDETMSTLKQVVAKHCQFQVCMVDAPRVIREKTLYMVSPSQQIELRDDGVIAPLAKPWEGDYSPSIDQVIAKVARVYAERGGAIIFTGMGDDGARSSKLLRYRGGEVWAQDAESCAVDSMPVSVESFTQPAVLGTPSQLAKQFVSRFARNPILASGQCISS